MIVGNDEPGEGGRGPDRTDTETHAEDFHDVVFKTANGAGFYLVCRKGFEEYVPLGLVGHPDATLMEMGQWLSEHPDKV